jgi:predicted DsbA family dithiol-disulfide isomerase
MRVDVWSDVVCPWCYLGREYLSQAIASYDGEVEVVHHSFELDPTTPRDHTELTAKRLATKYGMSEAQVVAAQDQMKARAADAGLDFNTEGQRSGNTRDAHRLIQLARQHGVQDQMIERLYRAYFSEARSIFDAQSLAALAAEVNGLDPAEVEATLSTDAYDEQVLADEQQAYDLGVTGVPFFVINRRYGLSGAQPPETLVQVLEKAAAEGQLDL